MTPAGPFSILEDANQIRERRVSSPADDPAIIAAMESLGVAQLRTRIAGGAWPSHLMGAADRWLTQQDQEAERVRDASQREQIEIARSAKDAAVLASEAASRAAAAAERQAVAAENANKRATAALIIAALSITTTIIGIMVTHRDVEHPIPAVSSKIPG
jgi:hypothetical protein